MTKVVVKLDGEFQEGYLIKRHWSYEKQKFKVYVKLDNLNVPITIFEDDVYYKRGAV